MPTSNYKRMCVLTPQSCASNDTSPACINQTQPSRLCDSRNGRKHLEFQHGLQNVSHHDQVKTGYPAATASDRSDENNANKINALLRVDSLDDILNALLDIPASLNSISEPEHGSRPRCQHVLPEPKNFDGSSRTSRYLIVVDVQ